MGEGMRKGEGLKEVEREIGREKEDAVDGEINGGKDRREGLRVPKIFLTEICPHLKCINYKSAFLSMLRTSYKN